jgi:hypothetical protein
MNTPHDLFEGCRHDKARLIRIGKAMRGGKKVYVLMCTKCGFMVSTEELRRLRRIRHKEPRAPYAVRRIGRSLLDALGLL